MKAQRQLVQVAEGLQGRLPDGPLCHFGEDGVAQFPEGQRQHPGDAVSHQQHHRHHQYRRGVQRQGIDGMLVENRHGDVGNLGDNQKNQGDGDPEAQFGLTRRP